MLLRQRRVSRRQFPLILRVSRSWTSPILSLRIASRTTGGAQKPTSFGFVVSHKVAANATDRNRLKRRARAIVRELLLKVKDNYGCLLFFKTGAAALSYRELKNAIRAILARALIIVP